MNTLPETIIIAAVSRNNVIGSNGKMPWKISSDLKRFKYITLGNYIIMGYKTFRSIGRTLPNRLNIVITRSIIHKSILIQQGIEVADSIQNAFDIASKAENKKIFIIGGGEVYAQTLDLVDMLLITHVEAEVEGNVFFPFIDPCIWQKQKDEILHPAGNGDSHATRFLTYKRRILL
ncbi:dihydrofolate reductase [Candidatus Liberibacter americanus]|uniref:Dihydrofolate reductase n=1 Tax=Candidatus Liberibacter americanus str. Sao Paulo TaxID=1261131 RepID=U6B5L6_9HYPH|nr:dihydrofolate reductase [Candidatus Liberibacter americanus]AHA28093.1 Dihydrofolate reductase [Candidatus Liberibacter americanus str. Sao Paulo]EMS36060.1 dihydrofolate reductase protein [Candidatus Liberibacter americanus PW_SP]